MYLTCYSVWPRVENLHWKKHQYHGDVQANSTADTKLRHPIGDRRQRMDHYELVAGQTNRVKVLGFQARKPDYPLVKVLY
jgi:hypothetical protein